MRSLVFLLCLASAMAGATTVPPMDETQLRAAADVVVEGEVAATETRRVGRRVMTFVSVVSGTAPALTVTLVAVPGGVVGDVAQVVPGAPILEPGRRYRLFLGRADGPQLDGRGPRARGVVGFWRGAFLLDAQGQPQPLRPDGSAPPDRRELPVVTP